eukprot:Amastigsp_a339243_551.p4 type:complete len:114 gc:universal Amastigsp_a339243_551:963-1304(+)
MRRSKPKHAGTPPWTVRYGAAATPKPASRSRRTFDASVMGNSLDAMSPTKIVNTRCVSVSVIGKLKPPFPASSHSLKNTVPMEPIAHPKKPTSRRTETTLQSRRSKRGSVDML